MEASVSFFGVIFCKTIFSKADNSLTKKSWRQFYNKNKSERGFSVKYELYVDVWFVTNFTMDSVALWISGKLMKQKTRGKRLFLAGFLGTAAAMMCFFFMKNYNCYLLVVHFVINPLMVFLCFGKRNWKEFLMQYFFTYLSVILLGGVLEFCRGMWNSTYGYWVAVAGAIAFIFLAEKVTDIWKKQKDTVVEVLILTGERQLKAKGFLDTGNLLKDPLVNRPVHIINGELLEQELEAGKLLIRLIPYHSLGRENGLLETVTLEGMYILKGEISVYLEKPVFGIAREKLFQSDRYDVILNGMCMEH